MICPSCAEFRTDVIRAYLALGTLFLTLDEEQVAGLGPAGGDRRGQRGVD